jgi:sortase A
VKDGEPVIVYWQGKEYDYRISGREVVDPNRVEILNNTATPRLTIFTCTPLYSTKQRLVLYGELIS